MLTYSAEHDASKVMIGMEQSQKLHICGGYRPRFDNFGMDCVHRTTLYVNVRHHQNLLAGNRIDLPLGRAVVKSAQALGMRISR